MARWTGRQESRKFIQKVKERWMALGLARHEKKGGPNLTSQGSGQAAKAALGTESEERTGWGAGEL